MTTKALAYLDSKVPGRTQGFYKVQFSAVGTPGNQLTTSNLGSVKLWDAATGRLIGGWVGTTENFIGIGHSLFALIAGWLGGLISRRLWQGTTGAAVTRQEAPLHWRRSDEP
jgi:hypothetical protein